MYVTICETNAHPQNNLSSAPQLTSKYFRSSERKFVLAKLYDLFQESYTIPREQINVLRRIHMDIIAFGNRVRAARERLGITQEDLAARVGMSPSHMSIVERGVKVPRMDTVVKLANELDVSADYLLQDSVAQSRNNQLLSSIMDLPERERDRLLDKAHRAPK